ncbi:RAMP superfamily CRISPR-associated protein [Haloechinothrix sp. LS1_15]|uniref:RAMP superfamily CRISPR-associated protein n=1 Tax=Haloechinothrix sp. LS1_15 TaxID=2652248 RepID=UPI00294770BA|nr:RAMP superfamily CRISPR-associated protein [Haloechinothrix sp. LS1_15]MDV6011653.1 DNA repair protein [Haloechinothrix sp. LS1_15]
MKVTLCTVRLRMLSPGGVGGTESSENSRNVLRLHRDPWGRPHLPGTTVAGNLRAHCRRTDTRLNDVFGSAGDGDTRRGSEIQVLGTVLRGSAETGMDTVIHTRTAIDRYRGAARNTSLHQVEQLPEGTEFDVVLRWNDPPSEQRGALLEAIRTWQPRFGRGVTYGAGRCVVVGLGVVDYDLTTRDGLHAWLQHTETMPYPEPEPIDAASSAPTWVMDVDLEIVDGLHIGTGVASEAEGHDGGTIARVKRDPHGQPVVPGSSLKGVLRSRAEYICRVVGAPLCGDTAEENERGEPCRPCRIFGYTAGPDAARRAAIAVHDAPIMDAVVEVRNHVAIDRFTGGARDQLLYRTELVVAGRFRIRVEELQRLDDTDRLLLHAVVADLHDGLIGIGARTTAGQGTVRVADSAWQRPDLASLASRLGGEEAA